MARRSWFAGLGALLCLAVVASIVVVAITADGREGSEATSNDGGAWLVNRSIGAVGHMNRSVEEVSALVRVTEPGLAVEVYQPAGSVVAHVPTTNSLEVVDDRNLQQLASIGLPGNPVISEFSTGLVVSGIDPPGLWRLPAAMMGGVDNVQDVEPLHEGTVRSFGTSWFGDVAFETSAGIQVVLEDEAGEPVAVESPFGSVDEISFDGRTPILRSGTQWARLQDDNFEIFADDVEAWERAAQPTQAGDGNLVGMWSAGRLAQLESDGSFDILAQFPGENFVAPIEHDGCIYALSNEPPNLWVGCGAEFEQNRLDFPAGADLRLRLVNGWIWVNDVRSGQSAVYDNDLGVRNIDDWSSLLPEELDPNRELNSASESALQDQVVDPDADDASRISADEFDDDGINEPPIAVDDTDDDGFETHIERPVLATVLDNDTDPDNDVLLIESITNLSEDDALVTITPDARAVQVTPAPGFEGTIRFRYTITDGRGLDASAVATVVVRNRTGDRNRAPIANTDVGSITAGERLVINVLDNDIDPDGDSLVLIDAQAETGAISFDPGGQIIYEPEDTSEEGEIELTYVVADDFGEPAEGIVKALVRLKDANRPPDARNDAAVTVVGQPAIIRLLENDTDDDGDELFVSEPPLLLSPLGVDVFVTHTPDGEFVFVPDTPGTFIFSYAASDDEAADAALIRVEVGEIAGNRPPIAVRDDIVVPVGESRVAYVLTNDGDPDGDVVGITDLQVPSNSGLRVEPFFDIGFRVFVDEDGPSRRTFRYSISDGRSDPVSALVVVAVAGAKGENQPPFTQTDIVEARAGATVTVPVLANDFDPEGGALRVVAVSDPAGGIAEIAARSQVVRITVSPDTVTSFTVRYDVVDDQGNGAASVIRVQLVPPASPNRPPIARPDSARAPFETEIAVDVLVNDTDPDGDAIQVEAITSQPLDGTARIDPATGQLFYTPAAGFSGTDRFRYSVVDAFGASSQGDVLIGVLPEAEPNRDPIARDDSFQTVATGERINLTVLLNDSDPDGDQLQIVAFDEPDIGQAERNLQRTEITYTAPSDLAEDRELRLRYEISDGAGGRAEAEITILVQETPPRPAGAPIAVDDEVGPIPSGVPVEIDVVANDSDPDAPSSELSIFVFDDELRVVGQTVVLDDPVRSREFAYQIIDADGNTASALIRVEVFDPVPPVAIDDQAGPVRAGEVRDVQVLLNDFDPDGEAADLTVVGVEGPGAVFDNSTVRITAPPQSTQYRYTIEDIDGLQATATISLIVTENQAPVVTPLTVTTPFEERIEIDITPQVSDPDPEDVVMFSCCLSARGGQPEVLVAGENQLVVLFTPDPGFSGDAVFTYQVDDQKGHQVAGTVTVTVEAQPNRPPTAIAGAVEIQVPRPDGPSIEAIVDLEPLTEDPDGDELFWQITGAPGQGLSAQISGSELTVTATDSSDVGTTTVGWSAVDPEGESAESTIDVTVIAPQNEPPLAADDVVDVSAGASAQVDLTALVTDDDDNEILTYTIDAQAQSGLTVTLTGDSEVTVNAAISATGATGTFDYTVTDRLGESATGTVQIDVGEPNEPPPTANDDDARTLQQQSVRIPVLANDDDPIGQGLDVVGVGTSSDGQIAINGSVVTFDPNPDFFGNAAFSYTIRDAADTATREATANVSVEVVGFPDAPGPPVCSPESTIANLTWTTPPNNGASITDYELEHDQGGSESLGASNSYSWADLSNGTEYRFRLRARNEAGWGEFSGWSTACRPDIEPEQPAPPQVVHGDQVLTVSWTPPTNNGSPIDMYEVRIGGGTVQSVSGDTTTLPWEGVINGVRHTFTVRAHNLQGWSPWSASSEEEFASTAPGAPTIQATTRGGLIGSAASGILEAHWQAVRNPENGGAVVERYQIRHVESGSMAIATGENANSFLWAGLENGADHRFEVRAINRDGEGPWSSISPAIKACTIPDAPSSVSATAGDTTAAVSFNAPASDGGCPVSEYRVRVAGDTDDGQFAGGSPGTHQLSGLENGTTYAFQVRAENELGDGPWVQTNPVIPAGPPICANGLAVGTRTHDSVELGWSAANFNGAAPLGYELRINNGAWNFISNNTNGVATGLSQNTTYRFDVRAVNELEASDTCGTQSDVITCGVPPQPAAPSLTANQTVNMLSGSWDVVDIACQSTAEYGLRSFEREVDGPGIDTQGPASGTVYSFSNSRYLPGDYRLRVRACSDFGCGDWSPWSPTRTIEPDGEVSIALGWPSAVAASGCWNAASIIASGGDPDQGCYHIAITMSGFTGTQTVRCFSAMNTGVWALYETFSAGNGTHQDCGYSQAGRAVVVVVNGNIAGQAQVGPGGTVNVPTGATASNVFGPWPTN